MSPVEFIKSNVTSELVKQGLDTYNAVKAADEAVRHYHRSSSFGSGGAFADCCNHAGEIATRLVEGFKYKKLKSITKRASKRPMESFI